MKQPVLIVIFSGAYEAQGFVSWLRDNGAEVTVADASGIEGTCCYCDPEAKAKIGALIPSSLPRLRWIDSGDYHYMSHLLAMREKEPFHLLLLDHHPDNQAPAFGEEMLSCGSWVKSLREEQPLLKSVLAIGPEENEEDSPMLAEGKAPEGASAQEEGLTSAQEEGLAPGETAEAKLQAWLEKRKGERLYVSLDKDMMGRRWARTAWTQGSYSLQQVKSLLQKMMESDVDVVAVDICGEMAPERGATPEDLRINQETNMELYKIINELKYNCFN